MQNREKHSSDSELEMRWIIHNNEFLTSKVIYKTKYWQTEKSFAVFCKISGGFINSP